MPGVEILIEGQPTLRPFEETKRAVEHEGEVKSPTSIVAGTFLRKGREGLLQLTQTLKERGIEIDPDNFAFDQIPSDLKRTFALNYSAVILGLTIPRLEEALVDKRVSKIELMNEYNNTVKGTFVPFYEELDYVYEPIDDKTHKRLLKIARTGGDADRSFSRFFTDSYRLMPNTLKDLLESTGALDNIRRFLLPYYAASVVALAQQNARDMEDEFNSGNLPNSGM